MKKTALVFLLFCLSAHAQEAPPPADVSHLYRNKPVEVLSLSEGRIDTLALSLGGEAFSTENTQLHMIAPLLTKDLVRQRYAALHSLLRRGLISPLAPTESSTVKDGEFLEKRLELLTAMGEGEDVVRLVSLIPPSRMTPRFAQMKAEALLTNAQNDTFCETLASFPETVLFFREAPVFCALLQNNASSAELMLGSLLETTSILRDDPAFVALAQALTAGREIPLPSDFTPLRVALLGLQDKSFDFPLPEDPEAWLSTAVASRPAFERTGRIKALESLVLLGAKTPDDLAVLYKAAGFKESVLKDPSSAVSKLSPQMMRALYFQAARLAKNPTALLSHYRAGAALARKDGVFSAFSGAFLPLLKEIEPQSSSVRSILEVTMGMLAAGEYEAAGVWLRAAEAEAEVSPAARYAAATLRPLFKILGLPLYYGMDEKALQDFYAVRTEAGGESEKIAGEVSFLLDFYDAFGIAPDSEEWLYGTEIPGLKKIGKPEPKISLLMTAASEERPFDTVVLSLAVLRETPEAYGYVLKALVRVGLEREARALAFELLLAGLLGHDRK